MTKFERNKKVHACHEEGKSQEKIGSFFGLSQSAISQIVISERISIPMPKSETRGGKRRLTDVQLDFLKEHLSKPPSEYAYEVWDKRSIRSLIIDKFDA